MSRSSVPERRSLSVVMLVMRNMMMNGNSARIAGPSCWKTPSCSEKSHEKRPTRRLGATTMRTIERGSCRIWLSTRPAVAKVLVGLMTRPLRPDRRDARYSRPAR